MLEYIHVKNLALIKDIELSLSDNLNILTGETGAGKSILLGSINLALGCRADSDMIRTGADQAYVELIFSVDDEEILKKLAEQEIFPEEGRLIISRRITGNKSSSRINGETVTLAKLKACAGLLIDIHGQHEHQSLLNEENHLKLLDSYGRDRIAAVLADYGEKYRIYRKKREEVRALGDDDDERRRRIDFLEYELSEIEAARVAPGEEEKLTAEYRKLSAGREISGGLREISGMISERVTDTVSECLRIANGLQQYDPELKSLVSELLDLESLSQDTFRDVEERFADIDTDEKRLEELNERLELLNRLKKKYGGSEREILRTEEKLRSEYEALVAFDENKEKVLEELNLEKKRLVQAGRALTAVRRENAEQFAKDMTEALRDLNFLSVQFEAAVTETNRYSAEGADEVCFMISTNPGEPVRPLARVASGGELSRIMLAIRTLTAGVDRIHTLIFDEIDTGISGRTARAVAEKMGDIAADRQVICISHLPQIAAMADHHFMIEKNVMDGETVTTINELDRDGSLRELARLSGTGEMTESALKNAEELKKSLKKNWE